MASFSHFKDIIEKVCDLEKQLRDDGVHDPEQLPLQKMINLMREIAFNPKAVTNKDKYHPWFYEELNVVAKLLGKELRHSTFGTFIRDVGWSEGKKSFVGVKRDLPCLLALYCQKSLNNNWNKSFESAQTWHDNVAKALNIKLSDVNACVSDLGLG